MDSVQIQKIAKRVLLAECNSLKLLSDSIPEDFVSVVRAIYGIKGRVIVSGVGKSGHIGGKISSTLASTGTPAQFVHATEANHGDLGMITKNDICLLISNSGESLELMQIIQYTRRYAIPLVSITSKRDSILGKNSDYQLVLPSVDEACLTNLVPTVSTTLTLALGDALAVALMELRGFRAHDFGVFHPGGKIGSQFLKVGDLMHVGSDLPLVDSATLMTEVIIHMTSKGFGLAGIVANQQLVGVISDGDLRRHMTGLLNKIASEVSTKNPSVVKADALASSALSVMNKKKIGCLFVVDDDFKPIGIVGIHDLLRAGIA